jgi:hypothetical protein
MWPSHWKPTIRSLVYGLGLHCPYRETAPRAPKWRPFFIHPELVCGVQEAVERLPYGLTGYQSRYAHVRTGHPARSDRLINVQWITASEDALSAYHQGVTDPSLRSQRVIFNYTSEDPHISRRIHLGRGFPIRESYTDYRDVVVG